MNIDFRNIDYLNAGNSKQKEIYRIIKTYNLLAPLKAYNPIIVGAFPINIDIEDSDIDIILQTNNVEELENLLIQNFSAFQNFNTKITDNSTLVCNFQLEGYPFEIFAQNIDTEKQYAYLHMLKEREILASKDKNFAETIRQLIRKGLKSEPAFCKILDIKGDPYIELLNYEIK